MHSEAQE